MSGKADSKNMLGLKWAATICLPILLAIVLPTSETFTPTMLTYMACTLFGILLFMLE